MPYLPNLVPDVVIGRLPIYLRALTQLSEQGQTFTSSQALSQIVDTSSAQIRKDLAHFGGFGKQGTGYSVKHLLDKIRHILHLCDLNHKTAIWKLYAFKARWQ